jgi:hypothetical protein
MRTEIYIRHVVQTPRGRPRCRWNKNIKITPKGIPCDDVGCIHVAQDTVQWWVFVNMVMNLRVS